MTTRNAIVGIIAGTATWAVMVFVIPAPGSEAASSLMMDVVAPLIVGFVTVGASRCQLRWYHGGLMGCLFGLLALHTWLFRPSELVADRTPSEGLTLIFVIGEGFVMGAVGGAAGRATAWDRLPRLLGRELRRRVYGALRFAVVTAGGLVIWLLGLGVVGRALPTTGAPYVPLLVYSTGWLCMWLTLGWSWVRLARDASPDRWPLASAGIAGVVSVGVAGFGALNLPKTAPWTPASIVALGLSTILFSAASALAAYYGAWLSLKRRRVDSPGQTT